MRTTDDTGLCAPDCACPRCEAGFRPTGLERAAARRALAARTHLHAGKPDEGCQGKTYHRMAPLAPLKVPPPYTEQEKAELARMRAERKGPCPR